MTVTRLRIRVGGFCWHHFLIVSTISRRSNPVCRDLGVGTLTENCTSDAAPNPNPNHRNFDNIVLLRIEDDSDIFFKFGPGNLNPFLRGCKNKSSVFPNF